jgi:hypothetical protein
MLWIAGLCGVTAGAFSGCGYTVGNNFPPEIRTIAVPMFTSKSFRRWVEIQLTEGVQKEIQRRTPYRIVKDEDADTRLVGKLIDVKKGVLGLDQYSDARELQISFVVDVTWEDLRNGKQLMQKQVPLTAAEASFLSNSEFAPEVGQSLATAYQQSIDRMSRAIVDMMENPW